MAHTMRSQTGMVLLLPCLCILLSLPDIFFLFLYDCSFSFSPFTVLLRVLVADCPFIALSSFLRGLFYKKTEFICVLKGLICKETVLKSMFFTDTPAAARLLNVGISTIVRLLQVLDSCFCRCASFLCSPSPLLFLFLFST